MATDKKISALTALGTTPDVADVFPLVDTDAAATKKVTYTNLGVPANTTHRGSDGKNHSDVVTNNAKISYTDAAAVGSNTTHRTSAGTDHADVGSNNTHRGSAGTDHADVGSNNTHRTNEDAVSGIVKCDGASNYSAAVADTDYAAATHASRHLSAGADSIKIDNLASPDDNTDLDVSTSAHGLCPKAPNDATQYLQGDAGWGTIPAGEGGFASASLVFPPINGNGFAITTGMKGYIIVPFSGTITKATLLVNQSSTTTVDIWKTDYANYDAGSTHPVDGDSITAAAPLGTSAAVKDQDATLTGWTTSVARGDILAINIDANDNAQKIYVSLEVTKS